VAHVGDHGGPDRSVGRCAGALLVSMHILRERKAGIGAAHISPLWTIGDQPNCPRLPNERGISFSFAHDGS